MKRLIEALQIFAEYKDKECPFYYTDEELQVHGYHINEISEHDISRLDKLGFYWNEEEEYFYSFEFVS